MEPKGNYLIESELIEGLRSGDQEAFRFLVENYQDKVIRTGKGFVHSDDDAEDIAQEVFIEVYQSISKFRGDAELSTWIYRIAVNKSLNFIRSASRRKILSFFEFPDSGKTSLANSLAASPDFNPDDDLRRSEQAEAVKKAIDTLPSNQKTAFVLSKYDDLSYQEIAAVMSSSVSSVESLIFRAKQNLQKKLYTFYKKNIA
ncbi:MAG TPA: sigma-70 family RNA polymerase sigma factor [Bacteroidales bacterium]|nr:sigma-70 family RNA polymerase sigma factor [Bacteroidales bacterium]